MSNFLAKHDSNQRRAFPFGTRLDIIPARTQLADPWSRFAFRAKRNSSVLSSIRYLAVDFDVQNAQRTVSTPKTCGGVHRFCIACSAKPIMLRRHCLLKFLHDPVKFISLMICCYRFSFHWQYTTFFSQERVRLHSKSLITCTDIGFVLHVHNSFSL